MILDLNEIRLMKTLLRFMRDRLIYRYEESPHCDYLHLATRLANDLEKLENCVNPPKENE